MFGPVRQPAYAVRFNSQSEYDAAQISTGEKIYYAPSAPQDITIFILTEKLQQ